MATTKALVASVVAAAAELQRMHARYGDRFDGLVLAGELAEADVQLWEVVADLQEELER